MRRGKPKRKVPHSQDVAFPKPKTYPFNPEFLQWLRTQVCRACGSVVGIEAAHLDSRSYGDEGNAISLCGLSCHREGPHALHRVGRREFQRYWRLRLRDVAKYQFEQFAVDHTVSQAFD